MIKVLEDLNKHAYTIMAETEAKRMELEAEIEEKRCRREEEREERWRKEEHKREDERRKREEELEERRRKEDQDHEERFRGCCLHLCRAVLQCLTLCPTLAYPHTTNHNRTPNLHPCALHLYPFRTLMALHSNMLMGTKITKITEK